MANSVKKKKKISYLCKNLLISFVFFSPFCLQTIKADAVDYWLRHNLFAASISISQCFRANLSWCAKRLCRFPSFLLLLAQRFRWLQKSSYENMKTKRSSSISSVRRTPLPFSVANRSKETHFRKTLEIKRSWASLQRASIALFWPLCNLVYPLQSGKWKCSKSLFTFPPLQELKCLVKHSLNGNMSMRGNDPQTSCTTILYEKFATWPHSFQSWARSLSLLFDSATVFDRLTDCLPLPTCQPANALSPNHFMQQGRKLGSSFFFFFF